MENKICPSCKEEINKEAIKCPKCQQDLRNWFVRHWIAITIMIIFLILILPPFIEGFKQGYNEGINNYNKSTTNSGIVTTKENNIDEKKLIEEKTEKDLIIEKLKQKAEENWPNDYMTQEFWLNQQIADYEYMKEINNDSIKQKAEENWPLDFSTQKFWYNQQIEAKKRIEE